MHQRNYERILFFLFTSLFSHHHLTLRKHGGHSSLLCFNDIHSRQVGSNRPVDLPGNVIVRARSTLPLLNSSLWVGVSSFLRDTIGDLAKLAGDIHTKGAGIPRADGRSWIGNPTLWPPFDDLDSSSWLSSSNLKFKSSWKSWKENSSHV